MKISKQLFAKTNLKHFAVKAFCTFCVFCLPGNAVHAQNLDRNAINIFIKKHAPELNFTVDNLANYRIRDAYFDKTSGAMLVYLQQTYKGVDVFNAIQTLAIKNDKVGSFTGRKIIMDKGNAVEKNALPSLTPADAVRAALMHLRLTVPFLVNVSKIKDLANEYQFGRISTATNNVKSRLLWLAGNKISKNQLIWQVEIQPAGSSDYWLVKVDAKNGTVIGKDNLTVYCNWDAPSAKAGKITVEPWQPNQEAATKIPGNTVLNTIEQSAGTAPTALNSAKYIVVKYPAESPSHSGGTPVAVTNPWELSPAGSPATTLNWQDDGVTINAITQGNNVLAQEDHDGNDGSGIRGNSLSAAPDLDFSYTPVFTLDPQTANNQQFNIVNLFYWNNLMHDMSYLYGFDEAAGNFQANNLGRGGLGNDYVMADAQDRGAVAPKAQVYNNANFGTPADGENPRMQMYLWNTAVPRLDGDADNGVVCHEYTHGISTRLTGGPQATTCLQNDEEAGEGWSDYFALMMTTDWSTATVNDGTKSRGIGTYAEDQSPDGPGIRSKPFSTNLSINSLTYKDVKKGNSSGIPLLGLDVHYTAEIWVEALWEMTWGLIQQEGINKNFFNPDGAGGNSIAMKLVIMGLKLQASSPGFVDSRDGILKADTLLYGGKYSCVIWKAFAKRGLGIYANEGSPYNYKDQVEDFTEPNRAIVKKVANKETASQGEEINYTFTATCQCADVANYTITDTLPSNVTYISGGTYDAGKNTVTFSNINLLAGNSASYTAKVSVNAGTFSNTVLQVAETVPAATISADWQLANTGKPKWQTSSTVYHSAPYAFFADEDSVAGSATLTTANQLNLTGVSHLSFWHYWDTEASYDGCWLEISTDNGSKWSDIPVSLFTKNGYDNNLLLGTNGVRKAFSGNGPGWVESIVDLSSYAGKSVKIRFQFICDAGTSFTGWYIDDINITSESGVYNIANLLDGTGAMVSASDAITNINSNPLPVTWGRFTAVKQGASSLLEWSTVTEHNSDVFIIERSTGGAAFTEIGRVKAAGNSNVTKNYSFTDNSPQVGDNQYRIRQVDIDGKFFISEIKNLQFSDIVALIRISPNPAKDFIKILVPGNSKAITVTLTSAAGKIVYQQKITGETNNITLPKLAPGNYFIQLNGEGVNYKQKIIIN